MAGIAYVDLNKAVYGEGTENDPLCYEQFWYNFDPEIFDHYYIKGKKWEVDQWFYNSSVNLMSGVVFDAWDPSTNGPYVIGVTNIPDASIAGIWSQGVFSVEGGDSVFSIRSTHTFVAKSMIISIRPNFTIRANSALYAYGSTIKCLNNLILTNPCIFKTPDCALIYNALVVN